MKYDFCFFYHPHSYDMVPDAQLGLGLLSLASYAKELGASVYVANAQSDTISESMHKMQKCKYLMMYGCLIDLPILNIISSIVKHDKIADYICVGGPIANSDVFLKDVDFLISGFGEDFVYDLYYQKPLKTKYGLFKDVNDYPFPDRSLICGSYGGNIFKREEAFCSSSTTLLTSRGCKYGCAFCQSGLETFFAEYDIDRIGKELESCLSLGINDIRISDDNLVNSKTRLSLLCDLFLMAGIRWRASIRVVPSSIDMYEEMVFSGCEELSFGIESGDQYVLDTLEKGIKVQQNIDAIKNAKKAGVNTTRALLMMGTPGETKETFDLNVAWIEEAQPDIVSLKIFVPYPNTKIFNEPEKYNCFLLPLKNANNSAYRPDGTIATANIMTKEMGASQLTAQFHKLKNYLEEKGIENRG